MDERDTSKSPIKAALFVDFDNIYVGLKRNLDEEAAETFATDPLKWVRWLETGMPTTEEEAAAPLQRRSVLVRRCYLNPKSHHRYRPFFTRAAFKVVDCPSLTYSGKNSADIQMVMDILDTLEHQTRFDEFIIFSGDADFTPVLLRLRDYDRRTVVLTVGPTAEAYLAACERVITEDVFVEDGLGYTPTGAPRSEALGGPSPYQAIVSEDVLRAIGGRVYHETSAAGELEATFLPRIFQLFPEFTRESNWLGFYSLRRLTERLVSLRKDLRIVEGDPWKVRIVPAELTAEATVPEPPSEPVTATPEQMGEFAELREQIIGRVGEIVSRSEDPVAMARAADLVRNELGDRVLDTRWAGAGSFRALLEGTRTQAFRIITAPNSPGYLCDPQRHAVEPGASTLDPFESRYPDLSAITRRVHQITGVPRMTPEEYAFVFQCIADELGQHPYHLNSTSKAVRDLCIERGQALSRASVTWILRGIAYAEHPFEQGPEANSPRMLARSFLNNLMTLCNGAQLELTAEEERQLERWICGAISGELAAIR